MKATTRRIMKLGRIVDSYLKSFPEFERFYWIDEGVLRSGLKLLQALAKRNGHLWESYAPSTEIAHGGLHTAVELRDIIKQAETFAEAEHSAKQIYLNYAHDCIS